MYTGKVKLQNRKQVMNSYTFLDETNPDNPIDLGVFQASDITVGSELVINDCDWVVTGVFSNSKTNNKGQYTVYGVLS